MKRIIRVAVFTITVACFTFTAPAQNQETHGLLSDAQENAEYEGGRGLITLSGPSGLFINPTSATLPSDFGTQSRTASSSSSPTAT